MVFDADRYENASMQQARWEVSRITERVVSAWLPSFGIRSFVRKFSQRFIGIFERLGGSDENFVKYSFHSSESKKALPSNDDVLQWQNDRI